MFLHIPFFFFITIICYCTYTYTHTRAYICMSLLQRSALKKETIIYFNKIKGYRFHLDSIYFAAITEMIS